MTPELAIGEARLRVMLANPGVHLIVMTRGLSLVEVDDEGRCFQLKLSGDYPRDGELARDRWNPDEIRMTIGPFARPFEPNAAHMEPGEFLPTVERHVRFISGQERPEAEIRFVTPEGNEWHPVSTYYVDGIVYVDLDRIKYKLKGGSIE